MNKFRLFFLNLLVIGSVLSCKVSNPPMTQADEIETTEVVKADSSFIPETDGLELAIYKGERTRHFKLIHTKLNVSFDWERQWMYGKAFLILEPYFYQQSNIVLDAKGFDILEVSLKTGEQTDKLKYKYDGDQLNVELGRTYKKGDRLNLFINYIAKPNEIEDEDVFDNSKKGLHFINPLGNEKGKPQQIWTHGETESNSRWFPTLDAPNQKTTQEVFITVDEKFKTLSNGTLVYSQSNNDSTRTDYWKMDKPHAPYLMMMAVGDFAIIEDEWNGKIVDYYLEQHYKAYAKDIFGNTPEMMSYFSEILDYPFPWDKYSQVIVRDFVSGAMENTTASVFMEDLQVDNRELLDYDWDDIIAHELFHQWFGDLVTCESWANLPLNESFATYGEYLWKEYKSGTDEGAYHLLAELGAYLDEAETKNEDLIRYYYSVDDDMFDSHSYAKGGLILNMLRNYLGDDAFFQSLHYYLKKHEYDKAEIHELRMAFEHVSGEDLNWFFNQWFLSAGHPKLRVEGVYEENRYKLKVWQEQDLNIYPVYKLPLTLDVWEEGQKTQYLIEIDQPYQEYEFFDILHPELTLIDSDHILVGEIKHEKTAIEYQSQYNQYDNNVRARIDALSFFSESPYDSISEIVLTAALYDTFWAIREEVLLVFENDTLDLFDKNENRIKEIALGDPNPLVKASAISVLASKERQKYLSVFKAGLNDSSYSVVGQSLYAYLQSSAEDKKSVLNKFVSEYNFNITSSLADYYIKNQDHSQFDWFTDKIIYYSGSNLWYFIKLYGMYLVSAPDDQVANGIEELRQIAMNHSQFYNRLSAYQSLELLADYEGVPEILLSLKNHEKDPRLKEYYQQ